MLIDCKEFIINVFNSHSLNFDVNKIVKLNYANFSTSNFKPY